MNDQDLFYEGGLEDVINSFHWFISNILLFTDIIFGRVFKFSSILFVMRAELMFERM
jgi:hypothetical protein